MVVTFEKEYLKELYETGKCNSKKHRYQPEVARKYRRSIETLIAAEGIEQLYRLNSVHYEVLSGDKAGISSIRVDMQYRIEFTVRDEGSEPVITVCNILELSNHYK